MKFSQLPIGTRFRFEDKLYLKRTPLQADPVDGGARRLIPRSARVEPLGDTPRRPAPAAREPIPVAQLTTVMDALGGELADIITHSGLDAEATQSALERLRRAFEQARQRLGLS
jgi:hypothetical protein